MCICETQSISKVSITTSHTILSTKRNSIT
uniref:Uncharacterized protein n=1 Tax=Rhizophora mucronata TaxID=61149 RepID=A0A2P2NF73_RHIMU